MDDRLYKHVGISYTNGTPIYVYNNIIMLKIKIKFRLNFFFLPRLILNFLCLLAPIIHE